MFLLLSLLSIVTSVAHAHVAAWHPAMYCFNGTGNPNVQDTNDAVSPLYMLPKSEWWMHHVNKCDEFPPAPGDFLELPAGGSFTVELSLNRAFTSYSYNGQRVSEWEDGQQHPEDWNDPNCIVVPNIHTQNETMAAGTVFAISYQSDLQKVTPENLVVFTVRHHTPWKRLTTYDVPAGLPECPPGGCHCVWGWVPNHCGPLNMYMLPYKCKVTNPVGFFPLARRNLLYGAKIRSQNASKEQSKWSFSTSWMGIMCLLMVSGGWAVEESDL